MEVQHFKVVKFQTAVGLKRIWKILLFEWRKKAKYLNISIRKVEEFKRLKILKYEKWEKYKALDNNSGNTESWLQYNKKKNNNFKIILKIWKHEWETQSFFSYGRLSFCALL